METKDIRLALEHLNVLAERSHAEDWPSAIERDLMLAELRKIYDALLFAAPQQKTVQPAAEAVAAAAAAAAVAQSAAAAAEIAAAEPAGADAAAEDGPDLEPLDLDGDLESALEEPKAAESEVPAGEQAEPETPAVPETPVIAAEPEPEPETEPEPEQETPAEDVGPAAEPAAEASPSEPAVQGKNLLFDLGTVQHRTHRRMMSLYDDETFDRLPDTPASAAPMQSPAAQSVEAEQPAPAPAPAPESIPAPASESAPESRPEEPAEEPQPDEMTAVAEEENTDSADEVIWDADEDAIAEPAPEPAPEPEPKPVYEPVAAPVSEEAPESDFDPEPLSVPASARPAQPAQPAQTVLGDVMNSEVEVLGDILAPQASLGDTLAHAPVTGGLTSALGLSERYQIIAELFGGDADACDAAFGQLDAMESLEDAVIYIEENFNWNPSSSATALVMDLLDRKFN